ncbi:DUF2254 domain-containing protein [Kitasatospora sp. NPDC094015]|uniref:DUF2254 domain-containing protein n=1 Tax=Kitasatospora sp. NPDC094015 TaxID=3155205 RepID=UPI0033256BA0
MSDRRPAPRQPGRQRRYRPLSPLREHLRDSFWVAPLVACVGAVLLAGLTDWLDQEVYRSTLRENGSAEDLLRFTGAAKSVVSTVSSAMLTFIGVVFSISLVSLQMAASQFSPRVLRLYVRSRLTKATFSTCLATFVFTLLVQLTYDDTTDPAKAVSVPITSTLAAVLLVMLSLAFFVLYVQATLRLLRVPHVIDRVTRESLAVLTQYHRLAPEEAEPGRPQGGRTLLHEGSAGVLRDVNIGRLVRVARRHDVVLRLVPRIGDFIAPGTPTVVVTGAGAPRPRRIAAALNVGVDRTMHQDLSFGFRQLVDIAIRALSPAVNDPTTAVQAIDRIYQLTAVLAAESFGELRYRDRAGRVRLVQPVAGWADTVDLAFTEIRLCGAAHPQVTRRLAAALDDLLRIAPEPHRPPLRAQRELLVRAVAANVGDPEDRAFALRPDRQGIG